MKVAAWQAPYLPFGSFDAVDLIRARLDTCEEAGVDLLCCPETLLGGLAHEAAGQSPLEVATRLGRPHERRGQLRLRRPLAGK